MPAFTKPTTRASRSSADALDRDRCLRADLGDRCLDHPRALDLASRLGLVAFTHAFKRSTGEAPTQRRRARADIARNPPGAVEPGSA